MTDTVKIVGATIAGIVIGLLISAGTNTLGGVYNQVEQTFREGIKVGTSDQFTVSDAGAITASGAITSTGALTVTGTGSVSATTTLSDTVNFNNGGIYINFYATSTDTRTHMQASTTATIEGVDGVMMWGYGACAL